MVTSSAPVRLQLLRNSAPRATYFTTPVKPSIPSILSIPSIPSKGGRFFSRWL